MSKVKSEKASEMWKVCTLLVFFGMTSVAIFFIVQLINSKAVRRIISDFTIISLEHSINIFARLLLVLFVTI